MAVPCQPRSHSNARECLLQSLHLNFPGLFPRNFVVKERIENRCRCPGSTTAGVSNFVYAKTPRRRFFSIRLSPSTRRRNTPPRRNAHNTTFSPIASDALVTGSDDLLGFAGIGKDIGKVSSPVSPAGRRTWT